MYPACLIYCLSYSTFWSLVDLFFCVSLPFKIEIYNLSITNNCWLESQFFLSHFRLSLTPLCPRLLLCFGPAHTVTVFQTLVQNSWLVRDLSFHGECENADNIVMKKTWNPELRIPDGELPEFTNTLKPYLCYVRSKLFIFVKKLFSRVIGVMALLKPLLIGDV